MELSTLFIQQNRNIGLLAPHVVIKEVHTDTLNIMTHPVENGANIADHAWMQPATLDMEVGFGSGGSLVDFMDTTQLGVGLKVSAAESYRQLREMQQSRQPLSVVTGKRLYENMLITSLSVTTDKSSEHVLFATLKLSEVLITQTKTVTSAPKENMKQGVTTSAVKNNGKKATKPAPATLSSVQGGS